MQARNHEYEAHCDVQCDIPPKGVGIFFPRNINSTDPRRVIGEIGNNAAVIFMHCYPKHHTATNSAEERPRKAILADKPLWPYAALSITFLIVHTRSVSLLAIATQPRSTPASPQPASWRLAECGAKIASEARGLKPRAPTPIREKPD